MEEVQGFAGGHTATPGKAECKHSLAGGFQSPTNSAVLWRGSRLWHSPSGSPIKAHGGANVCKAHWLNGSITPGFNFMASDDNIYGVDDDCTEFMSLQNQKNHAYWDIEPLKGPDGIVLPFVLL